MSFFKKSHLKISFIFKKTWPVLRIILSILLLTKAVSQIDWPSLQTALPQIEFSWILLAISLLLLANILAGIRWGLLMKSGGFHQKLAFFIRLYFSGSLLNQGLPTTIGGDSYRAISSNQNNHHAAKSTNQQLNDELNFKNATPRLRQSFYIVILDRTLGLAGNSLLGAIGLILGGKTLGSWAVNAGYLLLTGMMIGAILLALSLYWNKTQILFKKITEKAHLYHAYKVTQQAWGFPHLVIQLPVAILIHLLTLAAFWACLKACHLNAPIEALMIGMPALGLLLMLPISISGWGLREATLAGVLSLWGMDSSLVILSSIIYGAITLMTFLPGLPQLLKRQSSHQS